MKIGIITMPLCANYGGTLQNWALQQVLIRMGHEPITLRFPVMYQGMSNIHYWTRVFPMQAARFFIHKFIGGKYEMPQTIRAWKKSVSGMERFVDEHIKVTEYLPNLNMSDVQKYGLDALVVGSDQIWRPYMYDAEKYYFLGFTKDSAILRIAYAPSLALDKWPFDEVVTEKIKKQVSKFDAISIREKASVDIIKEKLDVDAKWVLDPTMLLNRDDYLTLCRNVPQNKKAFVFAYILDMNEDKRKMVEQTAKTLGCGVIYLTAENVSSDDTIEKWLANFRDSKYVITDSYHGTVFSLIFQKQFYCFYNKKRGSSRMDTLKSLTGLNTRFINEPADAIDADINYKDVNENIDALRVISEVFLEMALK